MAVRSELVSQSRAFFVERGRPVLARTLSAARSASGRVIEEVRVFQHQLGDTEQTLFPKIANQENRTQSAQELWNTIRRKHERLADGDPTHAEDMVALAVGGGGMAGIASAAKLEVLAEAGLIDVFDIIATKSAGTPNAAYILGGKTEKKADVYITELAAKGFILPGRRPRRMQLDRLDTLLMGEHGIDPQAIREARPTLLIGLTDMEEGKEVLINAKTLNDADLITANRASCAAPYAYNQTVELKGRHYTDGYLTGLPVEQIIGSGYKNIVVLLNETEEQIFGPAGSPLSENIALRLAMKKYPQHIRNMAIVRRRRIRDSLYELVRPDVNFTIIAPAYSPHWQTTNIQELEMAKVAGRAAMRRELEIYAPEFAAKLKPA